MSRHDFAPRRGLISEIALWGIVGLSALGVMDGVRSVGQNTEADSLLDHARIIATFDYNGWEQLKDYVAPQEPSELGLTNNADKAPMFDPLRELDLGHLVLFASLATAGVMAKPSKRE